MLFRSGLGEYVPKKPAQAPKVVPIKTTPKKRRPTLGEQAIELGRSAGRYLGIGSKPPVSTTPTQIKSMGPPTARPKPTPAKATTVSVAKPSKQQLQEAINRMRSLKKSDAFINKFIRDHGWR